MRKGLARKSLSFGIRIIHEDDEIIVVDKPPGLLTMGTGRDKERTAYFILTDYVRKGYSRSRNRIFIVHRLDRDASGILVFAKTIKAKMHLQNVWDKIEKKYLAVVHGRLKKKKGTISTYLTENQAHVVYSTPDTLKGKLSHTGYKTLKETRRFSLLEIDLITGRKHQIRVHLAEIGHPILGDSRYGKKHEGSPRLALHAQSISFKHPSSGTMLTFKTELPNFPVNFRRR